MADGPVYEPPHFRLARSDPFGPGVWRALRAEIEAAHAALGDPTVLPDHAVHAARRHIKRARSILRFLKPLLGTRFRPANTGLRDAARALSADRDRDVTSALAEGLAGQETEAAAAFHRVAAAHRHRSGGVSDTFAAAQKLLVDAASALGNGALGAEAPQQAGERAADLYRRGRKAFATARETGDDEALHEWRKLVKDRWHIARLLKRRWPGDGKPPIRKLDALGELLGADHDLTVLGAELARLSSDIAKPAAKSARATIAKRRARLRKQAFSLGAELYGEKPKAVRAAWRAWAEAQARMTDHASGDPPGDGDAA